jgi:hypothetical protein
MKNINTTGRGSNENTICICPELSEFKNQDKTEKANG